MHIFINYYLYLHKKSIIHLLPPTTTQEMKKTILTVMTFMFASLLWAEGETEANTIVMENNDAMASIDMPADASVGTDETFAGSYTGVQDLIAPKSREWKRDDIATIPKFGGYIIGSYKYDDAEGRENGDGFGLRLIRLYVDGTVMKDFKYRLQLEVNGKPHVKDATIEWVHWKGFQIKAGQFKRAFTFENPYNPWNVGVGDYSQLVKKLAGMGDRCGEESTGGRDLGVQLQGDLFKSPKDGHYQFHYQAAVHNGQGINNKDANKKKDFIGTVQWSPIKNLWIAAFGWNGSWYSAEKNISLDRKRYAFGVKYEDEKSGWSARAEYARSKGFKASDWNTATQSWNETALNQNGGDHADAWYATVGVPVWRWIKCYVKYDAYRDYATNSSMHSIYSLACNMQPHSNLMLQLQYNYNDDKTITAPERHYNQFWAQAYIRF